MTQTRTGAILAAALLLAAAGAWAQDANQGEILFQKMEAEMRAARTLRVEFTSSTWDGVLTGTLTLGREQQVRFVLDGEVSGHTMHVVMTAKDGRMGMSTTTDGQTQTQPVHSAPERLREIMLSTVTRSSPVLAYFVPRPADAERDPEKEYKVSDFELGADEQIEGRRTRIVSYRLDLADTGTAYQVKLWVDAETNLPVKRTLARVRGEPEGVMTESFNGLTLDGEIDPSEFDFPE